MCKLYPSGNPIIGTNIISVIGSPSNSSSASNYITTPSHQALSVSSNYDGQSPTPIQSTNHSRRPNRNATARSTPNLPTSTPVHNYQSPSFSTQSNQPILMAQNGQANQNYYRNATPTSSTSHTSSSINYNPHMSNVATHQNQTFLSSSTVSSLSAASIAAGRDPFTGMSNSSRQMSPSSPPVHNNQSSASQLSRVEEKVSGRGITRSSASYGIQKLLQEQVKEAKLDNYIKTFVLDFFITCVTILKHIIINVYVNRLIEKKKKTFNVRRKKRLNWQLQKLHPYTKKSCHH